MHKQNKRIYNGSLLNFMIMITKKEIKYIQSLYHKKNRDEERLFIAEGPKIVKELLQSDYSIKQLFATAQWIKENREYMGAVEITEDELQKISQLQTPNHVLAVVAKKNETAGPVLEQSITLVLDGIQDPGNMGTIIRIADWFGIKQIIAAPDSADIYNGKVIQSTMGSFLRVDVWYKDLQTFLENASINVYGALLNGQDVRTVKMGDEGILVIGNESKGISKALLPYIQHPVTIPRMGHAESLNAAVATGIILSHVCN